MKYSRIVFVFAAVAILCPLHTQAEDVTSLGMPFMTISPNVDDTAYFATGGPVNEPFSNMTDGNSGTTYDTWEGDNPSVDGWVYDAFGLRFASGISGLQRLEWQVRVFGDGGWFNNRFEPVRVQVTTDPAFAAYALIPATYPGDDNIWTTVPAYTDYPDNVWGIWDYEAGVPPDATTFVFEFDCDETIYGVRVIGDGGGIADYGFLGVREVRAFTGERTSRATGISPAYGATDLAPDAVELAWLPATDPNVVGHYVFLGTDPNGIRVSGPDPLPLSTVSFTPSVASDTVYYWHIDELRDDGSRIRGYVNTFRTRLELPVITVQPIDVGAPLGGRASFSVGAVDPFGGTLNYQWYYDLDGTAGGEIALSDGPKYSGADTSRLKLLSVDFSQHGYYFCVVDNGSQVVTRMARLTDGLLVAHWTMDGDPNDVAGGYRGVEYGNPVYEPGILGQAIKLDGVDDYIDLPDGFADFTTGFTVSLWAKPASNGNWARFIDLANGPASDNILFARGAASNDLVLEVYNGPNSGGAVWGGGMLQLHAWQMLTGTIDTTGRVVLYKNGIADTTGMTRVPNVLPRTSCFIGKSNWEFDGPYAGSMDDIRVYNYCLTPQQVADLYVMAPDIDDVCVLPPQLDFDGDCRVNLNDFAIMAEAWLECGRYPTCLAEF